MACKDGFNALDMPSLCLWRGSAGWSGSNYASTTYIPLDDREEVEGDREVGEE